jgi:endonuclease YncB( thermonuclease family)
MTVKLIPCDNLPHETGRKQPPKPAEPPIVLLREDGGTRNPLWWLFVCIIAALFLAAVVNTARPAEALSIRVIDGDTFEAVPKLEFGVQLDARVFRIYNFDAFESRKGRDTLELSPLEWTEEIRRGKTAKAALENILMLAKKVEIREVMTKRDPWGRTLVEVYADGVYVAEEMTKRGHARPQVEK